MTKIQKAARFAAILALALFLVSCSSPTTVVEPTQDIPSVRTESAQTVVAKLTIEAALNPTATPAQAAAATATQPPAPAAATATTAPTPTTIIATAAPTATLIPTRPAGGAGPAPTITRRAGPDQAQFVTQSPSDGTKFNAGEEFDASWTFKNIGTSTWKDTYYYRFNSGTNLALTDRYYLKGNVAPGESVTLYADMKAPSTSGRYVGYWELCNDNGDVFFSFYSVIDVP